MEESKLSYPICSQLLDNSLGLLNSKDAVLCLFNYLKDLIPFEHILCLKNDRTKKIMNIVMDYTPKNYSKKHINIKSINIIPWEKLLNLDNPEQNTMLLYDVKESLIPEYYANVFPHPVGSAIVLMLEANQTENYLSIIYFINKNPYSFTKQHVEIIDSLQNAITQSANRLLEENQDSFIELNTEGKVVASPDSLLRQCKGLHEVMSRIDAIAPTSGTVLVTGQTGVGKELVAESIHSLSPRWRGPLIRVNCGAIPENLIDSELFGHEKGSFTGANTARAGYFEQAVGGTIYLDEIGELPLQAQVRLLRVLESKEIRRVGGNRTIPLDIRVIAATNRDLWTMSKQGTFREDLWYRLNVFQIYTPSLAERVQDIPVLVKHFYQQYIREENITIQPDLTESFLQELMHLDWPGNVRELRYAVERAILLAITDSSYVLKADKYNGQILGQIKTQIPQSSSKRTEIEEALKQSQGRIQGKGGAAEILNISPSTLRNRMLRLGIPLPRPTLI